MIKAPRLNLFMIFYNLLWTLSTKVQTEKTVIKNVIIKIILQYWEYPSQQQLSVWVQFSLWVY